MDARLEVGVVGGSRMMVDTTDVAGRMLATSGVWEPHVTAAVRSLLRPGDVFVDVGANIGYFTLLGARLVGTGGRVHALEPAALPYEELVANVERNGLANVVPERVAAGATSGEGTLREVVEGGNIGASSLRSDPERGWGVVRAVPLTVPLRTLADVVPVADWPRLRLVKIDVEGYETEVLTGLEPIMAAGNRPAVAVELHRDIDPDALGFVIDFAERVDLAVLHIVDRPDAERRWAAKNPILVEYDDPAGLEAVDQPRVDVLLTSRTAARAP
jgi:FkbM family methyltransferase